MIPVYNNASTILDVVQRTKAVTENILIIDDGSDTCYGDIAERYGARYIKINNRGHLGARLFGISMARGNFTVFVDSDDRVSKNYHRPMIDAANRCGADIVINGWGFQTERTDRVCTEDSTIKNRICAVGDDALFLYTSSQGREHSYYVLWNKLFRTSLLNKTAARLAALGTADLRLTYSEDALMNFFNFKMAKKVISICSGFYFYRIHNAQSVSVSDNEKLKNQIDSMCITFRIMERNIGNNKRRDVIEQNILEWRSLMARTHFSHAKAVSATELYPYIKEKYGVKSNRKSLYRDGAVYLNCELLGDNFGEIDTALSKIYLCGRTCTASYEKKSKYISRIISDMPQRVIYSKHGEFAVPKRTISLKNKLIHNGFVYRLGTALFRKGSKSRAFLKRYL